MATVKTLSGGTHLVINPAALAEMLNSPRGPVYRHMVEDGEKVKTEAIRIAPVSKPQEGSQRQPGNLRNHIVKRVVHGSKGLQVLVGVWGVPYAIFVHEGAQPHQIVGNPLLVFNWPKMGGVVAFRSVNHPGNQPNRFLIRALRVIHS